MIAKTKKAVCLSVIVLCLFSFSPLFSKSVSFHFKAHAQEPLVQELIPGFDYVKFFKDNNDFGYDPLTTANQNAATFGAYVIEPVGDKLYIGFSAGSPGNYDGALLAVYENGVLTPLGLCMDQSCTTIKRGLTEQGVHDMTYVNGKLYIAGTDPCCNDDWTKGNVYTYTPGSNIIKHRTMENVLHTLGLWVDPSNNDIYAATGAHNGDNQTWVARIYKSTDGASSWTPSDVSDYRVYDVIRYQNNLYATIQTTADEWFLLKSTDNGQTWSYIKYKYYYYQGGNQVVGYDHLHPAFKPRLTLFKDKLIGRDYFQNKLFIISGDEYAKKIDLPVPIPSQWNIFANVNDEFLYAITGDKRLVRTSDLQYWYEVARFDTQPVSLSYWPEKNLLVVADQGENAKIWSIDLSKVTDLPVIPTPAPTSTPTPRPTITPTLTPTPFIVPPIPSSNGKIVFSSSSEISMMNPDGSTIQKIYQVSETGGYSASYPSWSFDGRYLVFAGSKYNSSEYSTYYNLITKELKTGTVRKLLPVDEKNNQIAYPLFSPDGRSIFFSKKVNDRFKIFKIDIAGGTVTTILDPSQSTGDYMLGSISPDGSKLLYVLHGAGTESGNEDVFIADIDGGNRTNLTRKNVSGMVLQHFDPAFSPDGKSIVYGAGSTLEIMDLTTGTAGKMIGNDGMNQSKPSFSLDGSKIVYLAAASPSYIQKIYLVNTDGTGKTLIYDYQSNPINTIAQHSWAPDPNYIGPTPICANFEESCADMECCSPFTCDPFPPDPICRLLSVTLTPTITPPPTHCTPLGDIDCSGQVGILDLSALLSGFGKKTGESGFNVKTDLDNSGEITILDLSTLLGNFGRVF